ncbi:hypothetical protein [Pedobacter sp. SYSU D00535]|uniref:hypothetical protein n=1 Tax=Pedobacter sp. SYSU D00535 TaxID=2810308 RepID=UPI001A9670BA|nr:hypothetical protein [Pedobacter sp. SYSU D00535]
MKKLTVLAFVLFSLNAASQTKIKASDAGKHIGDSVSITETVSGGRYLESASLTLLNLGGVFPNQLLTLVIRGEDRAKFKANPEELFKGKTIIVAGKISEFRNRPQITITDPKQIVIVD